MSLCFTIVLHSAQAVANPLRSGARGEGWGGRWNAFPPPPELAIRSSLRSHLLSQNPLSLPDKVHIKDIQRHLLILDSSQFIFIINYFIN